MSVKYIFFVFTINLFCLSQGLYAGRSINPDRIPDDSDLLFALRDSITELNDVYRLRDTGNITQALEKLAAYLRQKSSQRYYFNWSSFPNRLAEYMQFYPPAIKQHEALARYQKTTFSPKTSWQLPFDNLRGEAVTAYELRHLARQQKSVDMALMYFAENETENLDYFISQVTDLNRAFEENAYDDAGNGVYEVFRAGKRVQNWIFCHQLYLNTPEYNDQEQLLLVRTLLHHGAQLYNRGQKVRYGNHHTRGLVALFEIAVLFPEFTDSDKWQEMAIAGLIWHIENEVNRDGFQFERSVHYHKGDIENYFRVYQLAQRNHVQLPETYLQQFRKLFESLVILAQPNRKLPVLQDDTDTPFTENNEMADALSLGTLMFNDPQFRYFASDTIPSAVYWLVNDNQLKQINEIRPESPRVQSTELAHTGYYVMRNGWGSGDVYATISAGLSEHKPDHQHGDMLGMVAWANGHEILPNYQVRYKYDDYRFWKNSWVKNVALLDSIPQARGWIANEGGSGFGKWQFLPQPQVISWIKTEEYDHFIGRHAAYDSLKVDYFREVVFLKDGFWLVIDRFRGNSAHKAQQVWQGKYDVISPQHVQKKYPDGSGLDIYQLNNINYGISEGTFRNKNNIVFDIDFANQFDFYTLLSPFSGSGPRHITEQVNKTGAWIINPPYLEDIVNDAHLVIANETDQSIWLFDGTMISVSGKTVRFDIPVTFYIKTKANKRTITIFSRQPAHILTAPEEKDSGREMNSGDKLNL